MRGRRISEVKVEEPLDNVAARVWVDESGADDSAQEFVIRVGTAHARLMEAPITKRVVPTRAERLPKW